MNDLGMRNRGRSTLKGEYQRWPINIGGYLLLESG